jgi:hypothetical protein
LTEVYELLPGIGHDLVAYMDGTTAAAWSMQGVVPPVDGLGAGESLLRLVDLAAVGEDLRVDLLAPRQTCEPQDDDVGVCL